ncbi:MAG: hypothetical protein OYH76_00540 [Defluviicoccus sp.]|nr:hypothetical protein [Defluviicoccus sp.]MDE0274351.1 hypothetical protein [Defluviicoccus sp.]
MGQGDETAWDDAPRETGESAHDDTPREDDTAACEGTLTAAILRIGTSLDLDTVLREARDKASSIEGRFYGSDHGEVGGIFERDGLIGAFGGSR